MLDAEFKLHCHWVGYLSGPHSCSHPQHTSYDQGVSMLCPQTPWTWFETDSAQHVKGHFLRQIPTVFFSSEICDYGWDLRSITSNLRQTNNWNLGSLSPKEAKTGIFAGKVMASIFWDAEGVLLVDYLDKGHTITGACNADLLRQLREQIEQIRRGKLMWGVFFHQENAPAHTSTEAMAAIQNCGF